MMRELGAAADCLPQWPRYNAPHDANPRRCRRGLAGPGLEPPQRARRRARRHRRVSRSAARPSRSRRRAFEQWVARFRPYALKRGVSAGTYARVMHADHPRHERVRIAARAARVHREDVAVHQPALLGLARDHRQGARARIRRAARPHRARLRRRPLHHARPLGHGVLVRRRRHQHEIHAADHPGAGGAGLARSAPPPLLGSRTGARAGHRRPRLGQAVADDRLLGRRHGPHPMDAGGLAEHGRRLRPRRPRHALRQARRRARRHRALSGRARPLSPRRGLGLRGHAAAPLQHALRRQPHLAHLRDLAQARHPARRRQAVPAAARPREAVGAGARRAGLSGRAEFPRGLFLQSLAQLFAGAGASRRSHSRRSALPPAVPRRRAGADAGRGQGNPAPAHRARLPDRRHRRPYRQPDHQGGARLRARRSACIRPTAISASRCSPDCVRRS